MSRNKENIKMQLNRRLNELLRIGQKKQKESSGTPNYNPSRSEGIHSISSADTYRKSLNTFGDYCKTQNIRSIDQIDEKVVEGFLQSRRNLSGHTISKDFEVLIEADGLAERGTFIINPEGKIVGYEVTAGNVGRNAEELLRKVQACQFVHAHGDQVCPANWKPGAETLKPSLDLVGQL